ncbi:Rossmann-like domain-containing protein [Thermodesulfobacteriota bacterium]
MQLNQRLYDLVAAKAKIVNVEMLSIGLGYTAVMTSAGGVGLAYTYFESPEHCLLNEPYRDVEGKPVLELIEHLKSSDLLQRSIALAAVNALNYENALTLLQDRDNRILMDRLNIRRGTRVAMVGLFRPMLKLFEKRGAELEIIDASRAIGRKKEFYEKLGNWAEALILTSTSIINNTTEEILGRTAPNVKTALLGPSTPLVPEAFENMPVHLLAGMVPIEKTKILKVLNLCSAAQVNRMIFIYILRH